MTKIKFYEKFYLIFSPLKTNKTKLYVVIIFRTANASILRFQQPLPPQQPPQPQLQPPPLHHLKAVDPLVGPRINGAMTRTTMPNAIGMVELVVSMMIVNGTTIAKYVLIYANFSF